MKGLIAIWMSSRCDFPISALLGAGLPVTWSPQSHYWLEDLGKEIVLHPSRADATVLLEAAHPLIFTHGTASDPCIRQNFSAERAAIYGVEIAHHREHQHKLIGALCSYRVGHCDTRRFIVDRRPATTTSVFGKLRTLLCRILCLLLTRLKLMNTLCLWKMFRTRRRRQGRLKSRPLMIRSFSKVSHTIRSTFSGPRRAVAFCFFLQQFNLLSRDLLIQVPGFPGIYVPRILRSFAHQFVLSFHHGQELPLPFRSCLC